VTARACPQQARGCSQAGRATEMLEGSRAAIQRDWDEKWAGRDCVRWEQSAREGRRWAMHGPLYRLVQPLLRACCGIFASCFPGAALQLSSCPGHVQLLKRTKFAKLLSCQVVCSWKSRFPWQVLTCLVTHQHAVRPDASAGFSCVLLITCILTAGMPAALLCLRL